MSIDQPLFVLRQIADCPYCGLHQYLTENGMCRRCHRPIGVEFIHLPLIDLVQQLSDKELRALPNRVGRAIRDLRSRRGISQEALARAAHTGRSHLSRIECGHVRPPLSTLLRVTGALGLNAIILRFENTKLPSKPLDQAIAPDCILERMFAAWNVSAGNRSGSPHFNFAHHRIRAAVEQMRRRRRRHYGERRKQRKEQREPGTARSNAASRTEEECLKTTMPKHSTP